MNNENKPFYGKIMLFGEYSVILGSKALVIPLKRFSGQWTNAKPTSEHEHMLRKALHDFVEYLASNPQASTLIDSERLKQHIGQGWWLNANIPIGYGAGSSGGVVAAIYEKFSIAPTTDLSRLKKELGMLENYFHGNSSGLDPLCCLSRQPVLIASDAHIQLLPTLRIPQQISIFLYDSRKIGMTGPLVQHFNEKMKEYAFYRSVSHEWIPAVNEAIDSFLTADIHRFFTQLEAIARFERHHLQPMIPDEVSEFWDKGLQTGDFTMKLCGSGGGGFSLIFARDANKVRKHFHPDYLIEMNQ